MHEAVPGAADRFLNLVYDDPVFWSVPGLLYRRLFYSSRFLVRMAATISSWGAVGQSGPA